MVNTRESREYECRALMLSRIFAMLAPKPSGTICDVAKICVKMTSAHPVACEVSVDKTTQVVVRDIETNVVASMINMTERVCMSEEVDLVLRFLCDLGAEYFVDACPVIRLLPFKMMVKQSKVTVVEIDEKKGKGVVATADIDANTIVTFYPYDIVRVRCFDKDHESGMCVFFSAHAHFRDMGERAVGTECNGRLDCYKFTMSNVDIYGDPNYHPDGCCGHMMNDADGDAQGTNNCAMITMFGGALLAVVALEKIAKGSELLTSYGYGWWKNR